MRSRFFGLINLAKAQWELSLKFDCEIPGGPGSQYAGSYRALLPTSIILGLGMRSQTRRLSDTFLHMLLEVCAVKPSHL